ncbi:MAG: cell wall hydrolase [Clostridiales bacterium]|nr:cell wall hydrolase [Clostridiales bacterium]MBQ1572721.1 cell wall hydrolase [Clostridiales bacterium]
MRLKRTLIFFGLICIIAGIILMMQPEPEEEKELWEKIPDEEVHHIIEEERKAANFPVTESDCATQEEVEAAGQASAVREFTLEDAQLLMRIAEAEAGNQGPDGMWMVMSVVLNRVDSDTWPDSISKVIKQEGQFSSVSDGRFFKVKISADAHAALARIETGEVADEIIGFEVKTSEVLDEYFARAFEFKDHRFYTKK